MTSEESEDGVSNDCRAKPCGQRVCIMRHQRSSLAHLKVAATCDDCGMCKSRGGVRVRVLLVLCSKMTTERNCCDFRKSKGGREDELKTEGVPHEVWQALELFK